MAMGRRMGPAPAGNEKVSKGTWKKLLRYCKSYWLVIVIAIAFSMAGSALTLAGPDLLSEITDTVTEGIAPNEEKLEEISTAVGDNMSSNMQSLTQAISDNISNNAKELMTAVSDNLSRVDFTSKAELIVQSDKLSQEDKAAFINASQLIAQSPNFAQQVIFTLPDSVLGILLEPVVSINETTLSAKEQIELLETFANAESNTEGQMPENLPDKIISLLYSPVTVNGVEISAEEQKSALEMLKSVNPDSDKPDELTGLIGSLPQSVQSALYTEITVDGTIISGADQREMINLMSGIDENDAEGALAAMDNLPQSIYSLIEPSIDMEKVIGIALLLVGLYVAGMILSALQGWIMATVTQKISKRLRSDISSKINKLPMSYYHRHSTGDILSRVTNDADTIGSSLNMSVGTLVSAVTLSFFATMLSATSLTASIAFVYTLPSFLRKSSAQTNTKNLLGEPKPLDRNLVYARLKVR